jgi:Mg-chelatase subunit ChlD/phage pi2 protein 07
MNMDTDIETVKVQWNDAAKLLKITPPNCNDRLPHDIIAVIDVSLSMDSRVRLKDGNGETISTKYTLLDIVKFSTKIVTRALGPNDNFGLVKFSDYANVVIPLQAAGRNFDSEIDSICSESMTDISSGLIKAFEMVKNHTTSILLFTDGEPNRHPPTGYVNFIKRYMEKYPTVNIHTFGYGNSIDLDVMTTISKYSSGYFNYISDAGMVGTVFCYAMANILSEYARKVPMIGTLRCGQDINIKLDERPLGLKINADVNNIMPGLTAGENVFYTTDVEPIIDADEYYNLQRHAVCKILEENYSTSYDDINKVATHYNLRVDVDGEIKLAYDNFDRWGKYYLKSLLSCYAYEYAGNFRDKGTQRFAKGTIFFRILNNLTEIFEKMTPQTPSITSAVPVIAPTPRAISPMSSMTEQFMNIAMGCFTGDSVVLDIEGEFIKVKDLKRGMKLHDENEIENIVVGPKTTKFLKVDNGLEITEWHPIRLYGTANWIFPIKRYTEYIDREEVTYNLVTTGGQVIMGENKTEVVTLGHGYINGILDHPYLGTRKIKEDLKRYYDKETGKCHINGFTRSSNLIDNVF